jgi:predicted nuclease with TOPRIM domain
MSIPREIEERVEQLESTAAIKHEIGQLLEAVQRLIERVDELENKIENPDWRQRR